MDRAAAIPQRSRRDRAARSREGVLYSGFPVGLTGCATYGHNRRPRSQTDSRHNFFRYREPVRARVARADIPDRFGRTGLRGPPVNSVITQSRKLRSECETGLLPRKLIPALLTHRPHVGRRELRHVFVEASEGPLRQGIGPDLHSARDPAQLAIKRHCLFETFSGMRQILQLDYRGCLSKRKYSEEAPGGGKLPEGWERHPRSISPCGPGFEQRRILCIVQNARFTQAGLAIPHV